VLVETCLRKGLGLKAHRVAAVREDGDVIVAEIELLGRYRRSRDEEHRAPARRAGDRPRRVRLALDLRRRRAFFGAAIGCRWSSGGSRAHGRGRLRLSTTTNAAGPRCPATR